MGEKEKRAKIRLTVEMDIDAGEHPNVTEEEVKNAVVLRDSDAVDGFEITTDDLRFDNTSDFFLTRATKPLTQHAPSSSSWITPTLPMRG